ncbi:hypothetical protein PG996_015062 [Apiospora saccharicola]|uniref:Uncharacterized protein n=1 Tax=Apiospora saccharicola TaxID=335842 RepID=A0ABR1TMU0_9PEZI
MVPATPEEIENHQRIVPHNRPASIDTVLDDINARAEAMGIKSAQQRTDSHSSSSGAAHAHTWNSASTTVSPPDRGYNSNSWAAPAPTPTVKHGREMEGYLGTEGVGASNKAAPTTATYDGHSENWEAYVATEIERIERRKASKKKQAPES